MGWNDGKKRFDDLLKKWGATLETQLAYEKVMMNPNSYGAITAVADCLRKRGLLTGTALYNDAEFRAAEEETVKTVLERTAFRIDDQQQRSADLEGVLFGTSFRAIGSRVASKPEQQGERAVGKIMHYGSDFWEFRSWKMDGSRDKGTLGDALYKGGRNDNNLREWLVKVADADDQERARLGVAEDEAGELEVLGNIWTDYLAPGKGLHIAFQLHDAFSDPYMADAKADYTAITTGTITETGRHGREYTYVGLFVEALNSLINLAISRGYFDPRRVDSKATEMVDELVEAFCDEMVKVEAQVEGSAVHQAIMGVGEEGFIPPVPSIKNLDPFDMQCFLIENISELTKLHQSSTYNNLIRLSTANNPGTAISRIQHGNRTALIRELMQLCPEAYALLSPHIKIYRVDYDKEDPTRPVSQQELHIPNYLDPTDIGNILEQQGGRYKGYGIKSFTWSLDGVQPAEVDNNISAEMTFYFQTVQDLFQGQRAAGQAQASPLDLIISSRASELVRANQTEEDIQGQPGSTCPSRALSNEQYDGVNFRIKAVIGWSAPPNFATAFPSFHDSVEGSNKTKGRLLRDAIEDTQMSLFLQQTRHLVDFKEDGTIELQISYQAALSGILKGPKMDILAVGTEFFENEIKDYQQKIEAENARGESRDQGAIETLLDEIGELTTQNRMFQYKKFLKKLYKKDMIWNMAVNPAELLIPPWKDLTPQQRADRAMRRMSTEGLGDGGIGARGFSVGSPANPGSFDTSLLQTTEEASRDPSQAAELLEQHTKDVKNRYNNIPLSEDVVMIPYFYLGDLLDSILESLPGYKKNWNFRLILSEVEMLNPLLAFQIKNLTEVLCSPVIDDALFINALRKTDPLRFAGINKIQDIINIGDIPISVDAFTVWFKDNVIKRDRDSYYLLFFIKDVCSQLISNALRGDCFGKTVKFDIRFDTNQVNLHKSSRLAPGGFSTVRDIAKLKGRIRPRTDPKKVIPTFILYSTDSKPKNRKGRFLPDLKDGIYHHYVGSACSMVKSINFQREDQPYLREAKIQKVGALGTEQLRELYSVNIELIGNTLYKNGQYIYVDPTFVAGDPTLGRLLGISGYYLITSVSHTINESGYDVSIRALQEGISFDENANPVAVTLLAGAWEDTPVWTAPDLTPEEREMLEGNDGLGGRAIAAADALAEMPGAFVESIKSDLETLADGEWSWNDAAAAVSAVGRAQARSVAAAYNTYQENREIQTGAQDAVSGPGGVLASGIPDEEP